MEKSIHFQTMQRAPMICCKSVFVVERAGNNTGIRARLSTEQARHRIPEADNFTNRWARQARHIAPFNRGSVQSGGHDSRLEALNAHGERYGTVT
ncbi:MAG TPA: hypothetical protein VNZ58_11420 [Thermomicrobiales bacterium]|nr:hypothetical protein [Thermomicrobiales bacterium]